MSKHSRNGIHLSQDSSNKPINVTSVIAYDKCMFLTWECPLL